MRLRTVDIHDAKLGRVIRVAKQEFDLDGRCGIRGSRSRSEMPDFGMKSTKEWCAWSPGM